MQEKERLYFSQQALNRRSFLKMSGLLAVGVAAGYTISTLCDGTLPFKSGLYKVSRTRLGIGTLVSITLIHNSRDQAQEALEQAYLEMDRLVGMMNRFDQASALSQLNTNGILKDAPVELIDVINSAFYYNRLSKGAFEITVKPVIDLYMEKRSGGAEVYPTEDDVERLLPLIGTDKVEIRNRLIMLKESGMGITLDGIAKGYIVDRIAAVLNRYSISNYIITAGGEIRTRGAKADNMPWSVAIQDPRKRNQYPDIIPMKDGSISTSGNYEVFFDKEKTLHHIVDPKTGHSPPLTESVSVIARTNTAADALTKPVFLMDQQSGIEFINALPQCECLVMIRGGSVMKSRGWKSTAA